MGRKDLYAASGSGRRPDIAAACLTPLRALPSAKGRFQGTPDNRPKGRSMSGIGVRRHSPAKPEGQQTVLNSPPNILNCAVPNGEGQGSRCRCAHTQTKSATMMVMSTYRRVSHANTRRREVVEAPLGAHSRADCPSG